MTQHLSIGNAATWASYANKITDASYTHTGFKKIGLSILIYFTVSGFSLVVSATMKRESDSCDVNTVSYSFFFMFFLWFHSISLVRSIWMTHYSPSFSPGQSTISYSINWSNTCCSSMCSLPQSPSLYICAKAKIDPLLVSSDHAFQPRLGCYQPPSTSPTLFIDYSQFPPPPPWKWWCKCLPNPSHCLNII